VSCETLCIKKHLIKHEAKVYVFCLEMNQCWQPSKHRMCDYMRPEPSKSQYGPNEVCPFGANWSSGTKGPQINGVWCEVDKRSRNHSFTIFFLWKFWFHIIAILLWDGWQAWRWNTYVFSFLVDSATWS
jgi:hypothetical protein